MARANMIGWAMLLVAVMALYVGKAEGWPCQLDCAREHAQEQGGSVASPLMECFGACLDHSKHVHKAKPSAETQKVIEFLAQAPEFEHYPSVGRKAFPPSRQPMIVNIPSIGRKAFSPPKQPLI
ncbi:hypothetical protein C5167_027050 [Papaver somniferum]|uniref:uncharacterized protein LOC113336007 n=1 Tax=Papaver somniferum TaxID=3469 RepID=UPI000E7035EE|nr:uncharacterized protein LOC113336007 [Papaver somniferum]RZC89512.1 hypothetical protein C5167_027050 [Papaver somniferum]